MADILSSNRGEVKETETFGDLDKKVDVRVLVVLSSGDTSEHPRIPDSDVT
jgi:hypothetical protein